LSQEVLKLAELLWVLYEIIVLNIEIDQSLAFLEASKDLEETNRPNVVVRNVKVPEFASRASFCVSFIFHLLGKLAGALVAELCIRKIQIY